DPTTTVQAIDRLHDCPRQLARRQFPTGEHRDASGCLRLQVASISWDGSVLLAFDEIRDVGAGSVQVSRRLKAALEDLLSVAPPERRAPLERQLALLEAAVATASGSAELSRSLTADRQGIGSADELQVPRLSLIGSDKSKRSDRAAAAAATA
ncbi:MAG: DUF2254 domain-containing protein, partial [Chloroflexia bacterium]|nr:DUF2254 domain-containing protein [Chloroflexia bacterium]